MDSLVILIPIALLFTAGAVAAFFWAVNTGQYEDLDRSSRDILFDDDQPGDGPGIKPGESKARQNDRKHD
jgi:cbb3-type cytochrome oxidase maturation protein